MHKVTNIYSIILSPQGKKKRALHVWLSDLFEFLIGGQHTHDPENMNNMVITPRSV